MLYVTTRNNRDAYTAQRVLRDNRGPDGGLFVPFHLPLFTDEEILALGEKSFNKCVADILNLFFNTRLTPWDVDLTIGRYCVRLVQMRNRTVMGECWHNVDGCFSKTTQSLLGILRSDSDGAMGEWAQIGVRIAVLFGIFGELIRCGMAGPEKYVDISVISGDFSGPMSAWYARKMGLPIGNIILCCNENNNLWDLICHGQLRTDGVAVRTTTPDADFVLPAGLERLIYVHGGQEAVSRYLDACRCGATYYVDDALLKKLRQGIYVTVTSQHRIAQIIPNIYKSDSYVLSPYAALGYSGLLDYRAKTGERRYALIIGEKSPLKDSDFVSQLLGISEKELEQAL